MEELEELVARARTTRLRLLVLIIQELNALSRLLLSIFIFFGCIESLRLNH